MKRFITTLLLAAILVSCNFAPPAETATDTETPSITTEPVTTEETATEAVPPREIIPAPPTKTNAITYQIEEYFDSAEKIESDLQLSADVPRYMGRRSSADNCKQFYSTQTADEACSHGIEIYDTYKVDADFVMDETVMEKYPLASVTDNDFEVSKGTTSRGCDYVLYDSDNGSCFFAVLYFRFHENYFLTLTYEDMLENHGHMLSFFDSIEAIYNHVLPFKGSPDEVVEYLKNCDLPHQYIRRSSSSERDSLFHVTFTSEDEFNRLVDLTGVEIQNTVNGKEYYLGVEEIPNTLTCAAYLVKNPTPDACGEMIDATYSYEFEGNDSTTVELITFSFKVPDHWVKDRSGIFGTFNAKRCLYFPTMNFPDEVKFPAGFTFYSAVYSETIAFHGPPGQSNNHYGSFDYHEVIIGKTNFGYDYIILADPENVDDKSERFAYVNIRASDEHIFHFHLRERYDRAYLFEEIVKSFNVESIELVEGS